MYDDVTRWCPSPMQMSVYPIREVVTRTFRKRGSSTRERGRVFLRIVSLQDSGVQFSQHDRDQFHFRHVDFSSQFKSRVDLTLVKASCNTLNSDGSPITSKSHTHPSQSQTSRLLTLSLSLGVPVPSGTQCM